MYQKVNHQQPKKSLINATKRLIKEKEKENWDGKLQTLQVQGKFAEAVALEEETRLWSRIMDGLPKGQLSFLLRTSSDTLPTPMNLHRWRYRVSASCPLCQQSMCTIAHILNGCPSSLNDGRYTWRHVSVLYSIYQDLTNLLGSHSVTIYVYADLLGLRASEQPPATLPLHICATSSRPDIVIVKGVELHFLELTVCGNTPTAIQNANQRKSNKTEYLHLLSDCRRKGWAASYHTIEIGTLGHYNPVAPRQLSGFSKTISTSAWRQLLTTASEVAINCSYFLFSARSSAVWPTNKPLFITSRH